MLGRSRPGGKTKSPAVRCVQRVQNRWGRPCGKHVRTTTHLRRRVGVYLPHVESPSPRRCHPRRPRLFPDSGRRRRISSSGGGSAVVSVPRSLSLFALLLLLCWASACYPLPPSSRQAPSTHDHDRTHGRDREAGVVSEVGKADGDDPEAGARRGGGDAALPHLAETRQVTLRVVGFVFVFIGAENKNAKLSHDGMGSLTQQQQQQSCRSWPSLQRWTGASSAT